jgi:hypothetical protein
MFHVLDSDHLHHRCIGHTWRIGSVYSTISSFFHLQPPQFVVDVIGLGLHICRLQDGRLVHMGGWHMPLWSYLQDSRC